jgi:hypothetical protein
VVGGGFMVGRQLVEGTGTGVVGGAGLGAVRVGDADGEDDADVAGVVGGGGAILADAVGDGLGDGVGEGDGDGGGEDGGEGLGALVVGGGAWWVAFTVVAVAVEPCDVSTKMMIASPATTAMPIAPTTATAERKLVSSIQASIAARMRLHPFTTQHDTGTNRHTRRIGGDGAQSLRAGRYGRVVTGR